MRLLHPQKPSKPAACCHVFASCAFKHLLQKQERQAFKCYMLCRQAVLVGLVVFVLVARTVVKKEEQHQQELV